MCLSYPETISHPPSIERLSSVKSVPGAKKVGTATLEYARPCKEEFWSQTTGVYTQGSEASVCHGGHLSTSPWCELPR